MRTLSDEDDVPGRRNKSRQEAMQELAEEFAESRRLNEGLQDLWDRDDSLDCESARHRMISDVVGEPM